MRIERYVSFFGRQFRNFATHSRLFQIAFLQGFGYQEKDAGYLEYISANFVFIFRPRLLGHRREAWLYIQNVDNHYMPSESEHGSTFYSSITFESSPESTTLYRSPY